MTTSARSTPLPTARSTKAAARSTEAAARSTKAAAKSTEAVLQLCGHAVLQALVLSHNCS